MPTPVESRSSLAPAVNRPRETPHGAVQNPVRPPRGGQGCREAGGECWLVAAPANLVDIAVDCSSPLSGFAKIAAVTKVHVGFLTGFWRFLRVRKKFWMLPILIIMAMFGGLIVLFHGSAVAPFIYTLF